MPYISGLASGIDTDKLISQLMQIERRPLSLMQQRVDTIQLKSGVYQDVNTRLKNLLDRIESLLDPSAFESMTTRSSDEAVATATADTSGAQGSYSVDVTQLARTHRIASDKQADSTSALGHSGTVQINGINIDVAADMSLSDVRAAINEADAGVTASIIDNTLILESGKTGVANSIELVDPEGILSDLGLLDAGGQIKNELQAAQDAAFSINGLDVLRASNSVDDVVAGVTFDLTSVGSATISVDRDIEEAIDTINAFVDQYNSVQAFIDEKTSEKAILQGDSTLVRLRSNLRMKASDLVSVPADVDYDSLAAIGITIDKTGVMSVDESKLRSAMTDFPDQVQALFSADAESDGFEGIAARMKEFITGYTMSGTGILSSREKMYQDQMESIEESMDRFEERLALREQSLVRKFTEMEKALASFQTLNAALAGQIAQLSGWAQ